MPVLAETLDGRLIDKAVALIEKRGFNSNDDAREHMRAQRQSIKSTKDQAAAFKRMTALEAAAALPPLPTSPQPATSIIKPFFGKKPPAARESEGLNTNALNRGLRALKIASGE